jgi:hypothetical protein
MGRSSINSLQATARCPRHAHAALGQHRRGERRAPAPPRADRRRGAPGSGCGQTLAPAPAGIARRSGASRGGSRLRHRAVVSSHRLVRRLDVVEEVQVISTGQDEQALRRRDPGEHLADSVRRGHDVGVAGEDQCRYVSVPGERQLHGCDTRPRVGASGWRQRYDGADPRLDVRVWQVQSSRRGCALPDRLGSRRRPVRRRQRARPTRGVGPGRGWR